MVSWILPTVEPSQLTTVEPTTAPVAVVRALREKGPSS